VGGQRGQVCKDRRARYLLPLGSRRTRAKTCPRSSRTANPGPRAGAAAGFPSVAFSASWVRAWSRERPTTTPVGIGTFVQVGSQFGYSLLWASVLILPLMATVQELCARIALETKVGLGVSLRRKFPRWLVAISIFGLLLANTLNLGADLGAVAAGIDLLTGRAVKAIWLVVPVAAIVLAFQVVGRYELIFKTFKWLTLVLFAYLGAAILSRPNLKKSWCWMAWCRTPS
jgi:natural resistance-associated macrophage protein